MYDKSSDFSENKMFRYAVELPEQCQLAGPAGGEHLLKSD